MTDRSPGKSHVPSSIMLHVTHVYLNASCPNDQACKVLYFGSCPCCSISVHVHIPNGVNNEHAEAQVFPIHAERRQCVRHQYPRRGRCPRVQFLARDRHFRATQRLQIHSFTSFPSKILEAISPPWVATSVSVSAVPA